MEQDFKHENISQVRKIQGEITWELIHLQMETLRKKKSRMDEQSDPIINSSRSQQLLHYSF